MKPCWSFDDLIQLGQPQVEEMRRVGRRHSKSGDPTESVAFTRQIRVLEGVLIQTYGMAASLARKTEDLKEIAGIWKQMSEFCHSMLGVLATLKEKYPSCGLPELYDLALDYKLASD